MAGIDYSLASLQQREQFALTQSRQRQLLCWIKDQPGILGAVLLCTCNRTELYLSYFPDTAPDPVEMLCGQLHIREQTARPLFRVRQGEKEVFFHLGRLSCGAKSQIWGEDQIITQVKNALALSREEKEMCIRDRFKTVGKWYANGIKLFQDDLFRVPCPDHSP